LRGVICDLDGVVYRGNQLLPGAVETITELRRRGVRVMFATNNSSRTRVDYVARLRSFGIECEEREVTCSSYAAALYLRRAGYRRVLMVGSPALRRELQGQGLVVRRRPPYEAVLVGLDFKLTYDKLARAQAALLAGASYVATNLDLRFPAEDRVLPGVGCIVRALSAASGRRPHAIGKPQPELYRLLLEENGLTSHEVAAVGDNLATDIEAGRRLDIPTVLVLTGVDSAREALSANGARPTVVTEGISGLLDLDWWGGGRRK
jgi:4-nitrophenyl phosphatase